MNREMFWGCSPVFPSSAVVEKGVFVMLGELIDEEVDGVLQRQRVGRIGVSEDGQVLIEPIVYGYDGTSLYGHSRPGRKTECLRNHHQICFEVEEIESPNSWRVVLLTGIFHELHDPKERERALRLIMGQAGGGPFSEATRAREGEDLVIYRIEITARSGRYERFVPEEFPQRGQRRAEFRHVPVDAERPWDWR